jgi:hypothetical protein
MLQQLGSANFPTVDPNVAVNAAVNDSEAKAAMLRIAKDYEHLARRAEDRALGRLPQHNRGASA